MQNTYGPLALGTQQVLMGLTFPAQRWQLIAQADYYGAGPVYTAELAQLPERTFQSVREVADELARLRHHRLARLRAANANANRAHQVPARGSPSLPRMPAPPVPAPRVPTVPGPAPVLPAAAAPGLALPVL